MARLVPQFTISLRAQLIVMLLATLILPFSTFTTLDRIEASLANQQLQNLKRQQQETTEKLNSVELPQLSIARENLQNATKLTNRIVVDGYLDEWPNSTSNEPIDVQAGRGEYQSVLAIRLRSQAAAYANENGKPRLRLNIRSGQQSFTLAPTAPGRLSLATAFGSVNAYWQDTTNGYLIELPWVQQPGGIQDLSLELRNGEVLATRNISIAWPDDHLESIVAQNTQEDTEQWLITKHGQVLAHINRLNWQENLGAEGTWIFNTLQLLRESTDSTANGGDHRDAKMRLLLLRTANQPLIASASAPDLLVEKTPINDELVLISTSTDVAINRQLNLMMGQFIQDITPWLSLVVLILMMFMGLTIRRIRRINRLAAQSIDQDGRVSEINLPNALIKDEVSHLADSLVELAGKSSRYQRYLEDVGSRLNHELRTPLSVVATSLETMEIKGEYDQQLVERSKEGVERLRALLNALTEARRLEQSIERAEKQTLPLADIVATYAASLNDSVTSHTIHFNRPTLDLTCSVVPELLIQALDKLVDNAVSFAPHASTIQLTLQLDKNHAVISVENSGPTLANAENCFDQFSSNRTSNESHLGLGLYIVKLVAQFHQGRASISNNHDQSGVVAKLILPLI